MVKILVVDDSDELLEMIHLLLSINGYSVETANSKNRLQNSLTSFAPDLIMLDVRFNGTDGRELCKAIRTDNQTKHIPIILISASPELLKDYEECEANDILEKPFEMKDVIEKIQQLVIA